MITPDKDWVKYIYRSIAHHFQDIATANSLTLFLKDTQSNKSVEDEFLELIVDGPIINQRSKGEFKIEVGVNIRFSIDISTNFQRDREIIGLLVEAFDIICIKEYGDGEALIGRMLPSEVNVVNFGQITPGVQIRQGSVESVYTLFIENT
jgi:hypothetical protein